MDYDKPFINNADFVVSFAETTLQAYGCRHMVINKEIFTDEFYDLSPSDTAKVIRKFADNGIRLAVTGDFSIHKDKQLYGALCDGGIGGYFFFADDENEALKLLRDDRIGET